MMDRVPYVAGLVDGEGTITIALVRRANCVTYQPRLLIVNADRRLLEVARDTLGCGTIWTSRANPTNAAWRPIHRYQAVALQARSAIALLRPWLIAKADHADIILNMPTRSKDSRDTSAVAAQEDALTRIRLLNRRGRHSALVVDD